MFRYLLHQLSDEERRDTEQRYLEDDDYFDLLCAAEEDLIVAYLDGRLAKSDRLRFEEKAGHYLHGPSMQDRFEFCARSAHAVLHGEVPPAGRIVAGARRGIIAAKCGKAIFDE